MFVGSGSLGRVDLVEMASSPSTSNNNNNTTAAQSWRENAVMRCTPATLLFAYHAGVHDSLLTPILDWRAGDAATALNLCVDTILTRIASS